MITQSKYIILLQCASLLFLQLTHAGNTVSLTETFAKFYPSNSSFYYNATLSPLTVYVYIDLVGLYFTAQATYVGVFCVRVDSE